MIYVLDTSIIGFLEQRYPPAIRRLNEVEASAENEAVTTIITVAERIGGWLPLCRRAKDGSEHVKAYAKLQEAIGLLSGKKWLSFSAEAAVIFDQLRPLKQKIGANDLAIAAITLSVNGILVTRNIVDFERVPGLVVEDWTK